ncbi:MAG: anaerobic sulfatase maturase [Rhodospirillales bacterium]|jgi:uncharacterized protein|nr:anaerobic sulfatase maturase [Rhodospirillaceae bacterium]MDP6428977.1 anaerobic sulfatase maturase [Rhodospirillales bacterium]MDP6646698.1 anaerobic sulfatase maturase [Rhodospirillales bacterium]MDP6842589.1 anaerobic sulfatase maturase [Rhodospirillales bacterium]
MGPDNLAHGNHFSVMAKPIGPSCNLDCAYCYYTEKNRLYPDTRRFRMDDETLEIFIRDYIAASDGREITFSWQGGEPTLLGRSFFRRVVELEQLYCPKGKTIRNALQTNGTLLNGAWAAFLKEHDFLVGLSIDGPRPLHDRYRATRRGAATFETVLAALRLLRDTDVAFNTLTVVHRGNALQGRKVYRFLRDEGVRFMQFIPLVERQMSDGALAGPENLDGEPAAKRAPWATPPQAFGTFLCAVFDEWVRRDVGTVFVQMFDDQLGRWLNEPQGLCVFSEHCGQCLAVEHNGDLYACDHYVYPEYRLGNIATKPLREMASSPPQMRFGGDKQDSLPKCCTECPFLFACNGGCPKHRFQAAADGEAGLNYLCPSYKRYFSHTGPYMRKMAELLNAGRPPAEIMKLSR